MEGLEKGTEILKRRPVNDHPGDQHLEVLLCKRHNKEGSEYVTWIYNHQLKSCHEGHYFSSLGRAFEDFEGREG